MSIIRTQAYGAFKRGLGMAWDGLVTCDIAGTGTKTNAPSHATRPGTREVPS